MKKLLLIMLALISVFSASCTGTADIVLDGDYIVDIEPGDEWLHHFSTFVKTPPQYALWMEDSAGNYLGTLFITRKTATEGWVFNRGNRRIESLPVWAHKRDKEDESGVLYPSKEEPLTDGITGATPKGDSEIIIRPQGSHSGFWLYLEVNQSTDFNDYWPEDVRKGENGWSGGEDGSGQPSLIYSTWVDSSESGPWELTIKGHGSADGSNGLIDGDISSISTALKILGLCPGEVISMKIKLIFLFCLLPVLQSGAREWKVGSGLSSGSVYLSVGTEIFRGGFLSLEGGPSWELQHDMRMDDSKFRSVLRYTPHEFKRISPYLSAGLNYSYINTGYTTFGVPGADAGMGILFPAGSRNEFYLEGGVQYAVKNIESRYSMRDFEILYQETWQAMPAYLAFGWRMSFCNRKDQLNENSDN